MRQQEDLLWASLEARRYADDIVGGAADPVVSLLTPAISAEKTRREVLKSYLRKLLSDIPDAEKVPSDREFEVLLELAGNPSPEQLQAKPQKPL